MTMESWFGVDSTGVPNWHTAAETKEDCRDLIVASYIEEGDVLLTPRFLTVEVTGQ